MSNARELSQLPNVTTAFKNRIINGNMFISQRGTSFTGVSLFAYTLDRMKVIISYTGGSTNVAQQSDAPDADSKYSIRYTHATANTSSVSEYCNRQSIETANICDLAGLSATVSFWYKSSKTGNHAVRVAPVGTTGGSATTTTFTVSAANTWEYKTVTTTAFVGVTAWGTDNAEGGYVDIGFNCGGTGQSAVSSGDYFAISRMQFEVGSTATSFDYRPYGTELALCQRYYARLVDPTCRGVATGGTGGGASRLSVMFPVTMRAYPTFTTSGTFNFWNGIDVRNGTTVVGVFGSTSTNMLDFDMNISASFPVGNAVCMYAIGSSPPSIMLSAEL